MMLIFDAMLEMRNSALTEGRVPLRWEINDAGVAALKADPRFFNTEILLSEIDGLPMLGIPVARRWNDRSEDPQVQLIVEER